MNSLQTVKRFGKGASILTPDLEVSMVFVVISRADFGVVGVQVKDLMAFACLTPRPILCSISICQSAAQTYVLAAGIGIAYLWQQVVRYMRCMSAPRGSK
jgi:hypothetical protein